MITWFKGLSTSSKALVGTAGVLVVVLVGMIIAVLCTGGFNGF